MYPAMDPLYDAFEHPRARRTALPLFPPKEARSYGHEVRGRVMELLERMEFGESDASPNGLRHRGGAPRGLTLHGFAFGMIAQHEAQHDETMLATHQLRAGAPR